MEVDSERIGSLCNQHPLAVGLLHAHGIDTRRSAQTLADCCRDVGLEPEHVMAELNAVEHDVADDWGTKPLGALLDHILRDYHRPFAIELGEATAAIDGIRASADPRAWDDLHRLAGELGSEMAQHMDKEERVLFPWLRQRADTAAGPIRAMQLEHADTIALLHDVYAALRRCVGSPERDAERRAVERLARIERRLCEHMYLEEHVLFPRVLESFGAR